MIVAGVDIGSRATKAVVMKDNEILSTTIIDTGPESVKTSYQAIETVLDGTGLTLEDMEYVVATGYGRVLVPFAAENISEISCHARGINWYFPSVRTILDMGGQDCKAIRCDARGKVVAFQMNDKCAAGTGAFLEKTARYMGYTTQEIGPLLVTSKEPVPISGVCAVFAESEVINHLSQGVAPSDIMHGAIVSLVGRSVQLMKRVGMEPEYTVIGGILRFRRMVEVIEQELGEKVNVPDDDLVQFTAAMGAALLGHVRMDQLASSGAGAADLPAEA